MGRPVTPLSLSGQAAEAVGFGDEPSRCLVRLCAPSSETAGIAPEDAALVADAADAARARMAGFGTAVVMGDADVDGANLGAFARVVRLGDRFGYLADGDILGLDPRSRRFRVLYRKASRHNAFLVTERCNHYCLMWSQPPRDVDDGWILDEIETGAGFTNRIHYSNPAVDVPLAEALRTMDPARRTALTAQAMRALAEDHGLIPILSVRGNWAGGRDKLRYEAHYAGVTSALFATPVDLTGGPGTRGGDR